MVGKDHMASKLMTSLGLAASIAAIAAQPVLAFDGRSPDTRESAAAIVPATDVRSPDTRAVAIEATNASIGRDARDAGSRAVPHAPRAVSVPTRVDGFSWGDFGVGVGAALASMLLLALVAATAWMRRGKRRGTRSPALT
jgi:hypothetical protein